VAQPASTAPALDFAIYFASQGRRVLPIPPRSKRPSLRNWPALATTDREVISGWFKRSPNINYGLLCDGLAVVDVDLPAGQGWLDNHDHQLPDTWVHRTGNGGLHYFFKAPKGGVDNGVGVAPGIDVRGNHGMVIGPGSTHPNGNRYEIIAGPDHTDMARLPACLKSLISRVTKARSTSPSTASGARPAPPEWHAMVQAGVEKGVRNDAVARLSGYLMRLNMDPRLVLELMLAVNTARFSPPLAASEVRRTVDSIARRELEYRR
jgi:hypothetical protein